MSADHGIRRALAISALFNFSATAVVLRPDLVAGLVVMPPVGSPFYPRLLALFIGLFGGAYAWLARQPEIDRPLVGFAAIGKLSFFFVALDCWRRGDITAGAFAPATGDLLFGLYFLTWLRQSAR